MKNHKNFDNGDGDGNLKALEKVILGKKLRIALQKGFFKVHTWCQTSTPRCISTEYYIKLYAVKIVRCLEASKLGR